MKNVVTMCKLLTGDVVMLIDKVGQVSAFDVGQHVALWTHTLQVPRSVIFTHEFQLQLQFLSLFLLIF